MDLCPMHGLRNIKHCMQQILRKIEEAQLKQQTIRSTNYDKCVSCNATKIKIHTKESERVCTQCGIVQDQCLPLEILLKNSNTTHSHDMFSEVHKFKSMLSKCKKSKMIHRLNRYVETNINRFGKSNMITGDEFKDMQRIKAYNMIDKIAKKHELHPMSVYNAKLYFNQYRKSMTRIHKLPMVICACICLSVLYNK